MPLVTKVAGAGQWLASDQHGVSPFASHPTQAEKKILVINLRLIYSKAGGAGWSQRVPCCA